MKELGLVAPSRKQDAFDRAKADRKQPAGGRELTPGDVQGIISAWKNAQGDAESFRREGGPRRCDGPWTAQLVLL
jgi:hypothetical protein